MAVAAGVVIMAITNSANDRLRGQQTDQDSPCEDWEVHDIGLEAGGRGGGNGGIESSAIGCRRVCYIENNDNGVANTALTEISHERTLEATLIFSRTAKNLAPGTSSAKAVLVVNGARTATEDADATDAAMANRLGALTTIDGNGDKDITGAASLSTSNTTWQFQVHASGNYCEIIDTTQTTTNQRQVLRSP